MDGKKGFLSLVFAFLAFASPSAFGAMIELSATASYSKVSFAEGVDGYHSASHRYSGEIAFKFTPVSAIEFQYMQSSSSVSYLTNIASLTGTYLTYTNIDYSDKVYSVNWVQSLVPGSWIIQPYVKIGGGRMERSYTQTYPEFGTSQTVTEGEITGVGGAGMRFFLTRYFALKGEFETYVPKFHFAQWRTNETFSAGVSWTF